MAVNPLVVVFWPESPQELEEAEEGEQKRGTEASAQRQAMAAEQAQEKRRSKLRLKVRPG